MNQWSTLVRSRLNLTVVEGFDGTVTECPDCCDSLTARSEPSRRLQRNGTHALTGEGHEHPEVSVSKRQTWVREHPYGARELTRHVRTA